MTLNPLDAQFSDEELRRLFTTPASIPKRSDIAFFFDEGANQKVIGSVHAYYPDVYITTVQIEGMTGEPSDYRLLAYARSIGCVFVTQDKIAEIMHDRLNKLGLSHPGVLYIRKNYDVEAITSYIMSLVEESREKDAPNWMWYRFAQS